MRTVFLPWKSEFQVSKPSQGFVGIIMTEKFVFQKFVLLGVLPGLLSFLREKQ